MERGVDENLTKGVILSHARRLTYDANGAHSSTSSTMHTHKSETLIRTQGGMWFNGRNRTSNLQTDLEAKTH